MDLRLALNAVSDVVANRPPAIREFDQIYMKHADLLLQAELVSKWFGNLDVVFIGDGDAIGLCLVHLQVQEQLLHGPKTVLILDFDERVVNSVNTFARRFGLTDKISARLYNVADPLPEDLWQAYDAFYTNPPFGAKNSGLSITAFIRRGLEVCRPDALGCVVLADSAQDKFWPLEVLHNVQGNMLESGCTLLEMVPHQHTYHLDDDPTLTSCSIIFQRRGMGVLPYSSKLLAPALRKNFYGEGKDLTVRYVRDNRHLSAAGFPVSSEYKLELLNQEEKS